MYCEKGKNNIYIYIENHDDTSEDIGLIFIDMGGRYDKRLNRWVFPSKCEKEVNKFVYDFNDTLSNEENSEDEILRSSDEEIDQDLVPILVRTQLDNRKKNKIHRSTSPINSEDEEEESRV